MCSTQGFQVTSWYSKQLLVESSLRQANDSLNGTWEHATCLMGKLWDGNSDSNLEDDWAQRHLSLSDGW